MYVDVSRGSSCTDLVFQLGSTADAVTISTKQWAIKVIEWACQKHVHHIPCIKLKLKYIIWENMSPTRLIKDLRILFSADFPILLWLYQFGSLGLHPVLLRIRVQPGEVVQLQHGGRKASRQPEPEDLCQVRRQFFGGYILHNFHIVCISYVM